MPTTQRYRSGEGKSSAFGTQGMPAGMKNLNPSPGEVVGIAMNFSKADLNTIVPAGDEDNKV